MHSNSMLKHCIALLSMVAMSCTFAAQISPTRPVKLIVGFAPGGASDFVARALAQELGVALGQPVIVDNRVGAGGTIAARAVASAEPDGYTLMLGSPGSMVINPLLMKNLPYNLADFVPVGGVARISYALMVRKELPVRSVDELIALAKKSPDALTIGSAGNGSNTHLVAAAFMAATGVKLHHVPYKGTSPALNDLMGGTIDVLFDSIPVVFGQINGGSVRALAVTSSSREVVLPDLPTVSEAGGKGFVATNWFAVFAPKGTPATVVDRLNLAMQQALKNDRLKVQFQRSGNRPLPGSPANLSRMLVEEIASTKKLIQSSGISAD